VSGYVAALVAVTPAVVKLSERLAAETKRATVRLLAIPSAAAKVYSGDRGKERTVMRLIDGSATLVIAGFWNAGVLTPAWVAKFGLELEGQVAVTVTAPMPAGTAVNAPASFKLPGLAYAVGSGSLMLSPTEPGLEGLAIVQSAAVRILGALPHTPVLALGFNVSFQADDPQPLLGVFGAAQGGAIDAAPEGWVSAANLIRTTLSKDGDDLNVEQIYEDGGVRVQFNFHQTITSAAAAVEVLNRRSFGDAFSAALEMAKGMFNEELQDVADR